MSSGTSVFEMIESRGLRVGDTWLDERGPLRVASHFAAGSDRSAASLLVDDNDCVVPSDTSTMVTRDVTYRRVEVPDGDAIELRLDIIEPTGGPHGLPVVVFVPGGGFLAAPKGSAIARRRWVAEHGFLVASVEYRTVRHGTYVEAIDDVIAAMHFVRRRYGVHEVALWGESAGGYLASMVATSPDSPVRCVVNLFGLSDLASVAADFDAAEQARHHTAEIPEAQFVFGRSSGRTIDDDPAAVQRANPVGRIDARCPPFLLFHGELDGLVSPRQTRVVHEALRACGVESAREVVGGAGHYGPEWSSRTVLGRVVEFLRTHST